MLTGACKEERKSFPTDTTVEEVASYRQLPYWLKTRFKLRTRIQMAIDVMAPWIKKLQISSRFQAIVFRDENNTDIVNFFPRE
jgi:hypothetical protein